MKRSGMRCPTCDYSLKGLRSLTCPECGETVSLTRLERMEADRLQPRQRVWMGIGGGLSLLAAAGCAVVGVIAGVRGELGWAVGGGVAAVMLLANAAARIGACIRGRRGGWVDELFEMLRSGE